MNKKCKYNARGARNFWHLSSIFMAAISAAIIYNWFHESVVFVSAITLGMAGIMFCMSFSKEPEAPWYMQDREEEGFY